MSDLTYLPAMCTGAAVLELGGVGGGVGAQLKPSVVVKLQPSVVSDSGRLISAGGGYI